MNLVKIVKSIIKSIIKYFLFKIKQIITLLVRKKHLINLINFLKIRPMMLLFQTTIMLINKIP